MNESNREATSETDIPAENGFCFTKEPSLETMYVIQYSSIMIVVLSLHALVFGSATS